MVEKIKVQTEINKKVHDKLVEEKERTGKTIGIIIGDAVREHTRKKRRRKGGIK